MFDLAKAISQASAKPQQQKGPSSCTLFYQSEACRDLVQEAFRFEGWLEPDCVQGSERLDEAAVHDLVILELNQSQQVVEDARTIAGGLPNHKAVIVIGQEDAITTLRGLKEMGFYYLFWPVEPPELIEFLRNVHKNQQQFAGVSQNRKAKRVAVIGSKGGVGTSLISVELACLLAERKVETILVDQQFAHSNLDILLGLKSFQRQDVANLAMQLHDLDAASAAEYLYKINKHLQLLALGTDEPPADLLDYTRTLTELLHRQANFIIKDYSGSTDFSVSARQLVEQHDILVLVIEPSVCSVRVSIEMINQIKEVIQLGRHETRLLTLVNVHRPAEAFNLTLKEVASYLQRPIDITLGYDKRFASLLLQGQRLYRQERGGQGPFHDLMALLKGQSLKAPTKGVAKLRSLWSR